MPIFFKKPTYPKMCRHHADHADRHAAWAARIEDKRQNWATRYEAKQEKWATKYEAKQEKWANRCEAKRQRWASKCGKHAKQPEQPVEPPTDVSGRSTVRQIPVNGYIRQSMSSQSTSASDEKAKLAEREARALGAEPPSYGSLPAVDKKLLDSNP
jgi:hypothetical protein